MCIGVPHKVIETTGEVALVEAYGQHKQVSLMLMAEPVSVGDYLLVQVGDFAVQVIDPEHAERAMGYYQELLAELNQPSSQNDDNGQEEAGP